MLCRKGLGFGDLGSRASGFSGMLHIHSVFDMQALNFKHQNLKIGFQASISRTFRRLRASSLRYLGFAKIRGTFLVAPIIWPVIL